CLDRSPWPGWRILNRRLLRPDSKSIGHYYSPGKASHARRARAWITANVARMDVRQPTCLFAVIAEPGGRRPEHWHAVRRGAKLLGRHGTQGSNRRKLQTSGPAMFFIDY